MLMLVGVAVDNAKVLLCPDQRGLDHACVPPTMRWRVREGGPERRQLCDGGRFIAVESKEAELVALKMTIATGEFETSAAATAIASTGPWTSAASSRSAGPSSAASTAGCCAGC